MNKIAPLIGVAIATIFAGRAAMQFSDLPITNPAAAIGGLGDPVETRPTAPPESRGDSSRYEPAYKAITRCLGDLDDLLDSIVNPATFATVKPLILSRVRQHVSHAADHPQGMAKLSRAASQEMQQAMNRHAASLLRANSIAPGVAPFFEHEVASLLNPK